MKVTFEDSELREIREKIQLIETIIDGSTQSINPDKKRLSLALSAIRSIQSKYFPQMNYSLYYFRTLKDGKQPLNRQNYRKWKRLKLLETMPKLTEFSEDHDYIPRTDQK